MRALRPVLVLLGLGLLGVCLPVAGAATPTSPDPRLTITTAVHSDTSPPLSRLATSFTVDPGRLVPENPKLRLPASSGLPDPVQQTAATTPARARLVASYRGLGDDFPGFTVNAIPPDTVGAVGRTQYVQWVNSGFVVLDKKTGKAVLGPANGNAIWKGFDGECEKRNDGDPVVNYDRFADRWVLQQFAVTQGNYECLAVSATSDARGPYHRYAFKYKGFNDYPKAGVWSHSYVQTYNMFDAETGTKVCALDRAAMLAGREEARQACIQLPATAPALLPADADGRTPPAADEDVPLVGLGADALQVYSLHVDWRHPSQTALSRARALPVAAFTPACGVLYELEDRTAAPCIPQPGTGAVGQLALLGLDPLSDRPMFRLAWRRFADGHEAMVVTHTVDALPTAAAALRWYELRRTAGAWRVQQQGTYVPDGDSRWMASAAMDRHGGIALGYSVSGPLGTFPGIRIAGRAAGDPSGTLSKETDVVAGGGEQTTASYLSRWGDYSAMTVDPVDDCTLWYTTQYLQQTGIFNWSTKIVAVRLPGC